MKMNVDENFLREISLHHINSNHRCFLDYFELAKRIERLIHNTQVFRFQSTRIVASSTSHAVNRIIL